LSGQRAGRSIAQDGTGQEAAAADGSLGRVGGRKTLHAGMCEAGWQPAAVAALSGGVSPPQAERLSVEPSVRLIT